MKVVSRGVPPSERIWHGDCRECGSTMEAVESELGKVERGFDRNEFYELAREKCPVCGGIFCMYPKK